MKTMAPTAPHIPTTARTSSTGKRHQHGAASLIVVMVLFFLLSMVAAYTSRNLIFEQRTSVNQYRSTQAFEAAEAGLEWALSMLNGGRIGSNCLEASASGTDTSFRQRYLVISATDGQITPAVGPTLSRPLWPSCVADGAGGWTCNCPSDSAPSLANPGAAGIGTYPAFRVRFTVDGITRPGVVRIESNGCTRLDDQCLNHPASATELEGRANVAALVVLKSALPAPPAAALTVLGNVTVGSAVSVYNTDAELSGITIQAGGTVTPSGPPELTLRSVPGTPGANSVASNDPTISALSGSPDRVFAATFSAWPAVYRLQPGAVTVTCAVGGCRQALADAIAKNPDRVIWVPGNLTLESAGDIGSPPDPANTGVAGPALIVVDGQVNFTAPGVRIHGFVYSRGGNWSGVGEIQGAVFVEGDLAATAAATVVMNNADLKSLRLRSGSFVRAPGGWDDFRGRAP